MSSAEGSSHDLGLIWTRPAPGSRRPAHSREQIAQVAIAIADAEGIEAVTMRRVAAELGAGTMTLYHYVASKDELVALVADAIMAEAVVPEDELPAGWRDGLAEIARRTLGIFKRHPWVVENLNEGDPTKSGPSVLRHVEQTLEVTSRSGLEVSDQLELSAVVDDYVFGHAIRSYQDVQRVAPGDPQTRLQAMHAYLAEQVGAGDYPHLQAIVGDDPGFARAADLAEDEQRFERGLQRLLDGLALWVAQRRPIESGLADAGAG